MVLLDTVVYRRDELILFAKSGFSNRVGGFEGVARVESRRVSCIFGVISSVTRQKTTKTHVDRFTRCQDRFAKNSQIEKTLVSLHAVRAPVSFNCFARPTRF